MQSLNLTNDFELHDIKSEEITVKQLEEMKALSGSYESLFSKRAKLYKEMGLKDLSLGENDYKQYILEHYTFLKRPVIIYEDKIFIGNAKKTISDAINTIN